MKYIYTFLAVIVLVLSGCGKDPVVADIEAFDKLGRSVFQDLNVNELNQKMVQAKTNEDKAALMNDFIQMMEGRAKEMSAFKAKTPEMIKITDDFNKGINQSLDGAKHARSALLTSNQSGLSAASNELNAGQKAIQESANELVKLAKEKGLKPNK